MARLPAVSYCGETDLAHYHTGERPTQRSMMLRGVVRVGGQGVVEKRTRSSSRRTFSSISRTRRRTRTITRSKRTRTRRS